MIVKEATVSNVVCECCDAQRRNVEIVIGDGVATRAIAFVYCYPPHGDEPSEIWIDAIIGAWDGTDGDADLVTFGCRYNRPRRSCRHRR